MATDTSTILAPVIRDFHQWYDVVLPSMSISERQACEEIIQNLDVPSAAWKRPRKHPLYARAVRDNGMSLSFATFYCLRLIYVDHYKEIIRMFRLMRPHAGLRRVNVEKVRGKFKQGTLAGLARARFRTEVLWGKPDDLLKPSSDLFAQTTKVKQGDKPKGSKGCDGDPTDTTRNVKTSTQAPAKGNSAVNSLTFRRSLRRPQQRGLYKGMDPGKGDDIYADLEEFEQDTENSVDLPQPRHCLSFIEGLQIRSMTERKERHAHVSGSFLTRPHDDSMQIGLGTSNNTPGFGMTLSDTELLYGAYKQLKTDGTWDELEKSNYPPKITWSTKLPRRNSQQSTSERDSKDAPEATKVGEGSNEEIRQPGKDMSTIIASIRAKGRDRVRKIRSKP